ncbi:MAG TPA: twin-arginine translocase subunit TatC [Bryobacteraceae bacterium]|nr:twin-arginine translocase subunit TatC [Bryobacteraceae bacterium]
MASPDDLKGTDVPQGGDASPNAADNSRAGENSSGAAETVETPEGYPPPVDNSHGYAGYPYESSPGSSTSVTALEPAQPPIPRPKSGGGGSAPPPPPPSDSGGDEEDGMLRMSFLEHLEELRARIIRALIGIGVAFVLSLTFCNELWRFVSQPAVQALTTLGINPPNLTQITPMESFNIIWVKLPILCSIFLASPWILYQVWAFIAPGLYRRERRWAAPFVLCSAGLFVLGGLFAYFVAFRYGLTFLLSIGRGNYVTPMVSISEYFDLFVNVTVGVGLVFELPVLIFFLTLLRVVSPRFLLNHSRYAILIIFIVAAIVTPTPDVFNLMLFATPMCLLFFVGIFASYLLVLSREGRKFPWRKALTIVAVAALVLAAALYVVTTRYGYHLVLRWPFFLR